MMDGDKAMEISNNNVNKGSAVKEVLKNDNYEFILCAGDDVSDENMFMNLPEKSFSVKIGEKNSAANYFISNSNEFICLLKKIIEIEK